jgi:transposase
MKMIRTELMAQDTTLLKGEVEADETFIGGKPRVGKPMTRQEHLDRKTVVVGAVERGGRVRASVAHFRSDAHAYVREFVLPQSVVYTDEYTGYRGVERGYFHKRINHSEKIYVSGAVHTQTIEGFWALLKGGLQGTYHSVSLKHLQSYISEYAWRYNHRDDAQAMFRTLVLRAATA